MSDEFPPYRDELVFIAAVIGVIVTYIAILAWILMFPDSVDGILNHVDGL